MRPSTLSIAMHEIGHAVVQLVLAPYQWIEAVSLIGLREDHLGYVDTDMLWQSYMHARCDPAKPPHSGERSHGPTS
jgi:hypothetical protein